MTVQAYPREWAQGRTIRCIVSGNGVSTHFNLYDDGSELLRNDGRGFCDSLSGDQVAGDGKYSRRLNSFFTVRAGTYNLAIAFLDHPPGIDTLYGSLIVVANSPPAIRWQSNPDSIESGAQVAPFEALVFDLDGYDDISRVQVGRSSVPRGSLPRDKYEMTKVADSVYQWQFPPWIAAGYPTGNHSFFCQATDWAMQERNSFTFSDTASIWIENLPPKIDSIASPDTVWVGGGGSDSTKFIIDVKLLDDQTPLDLDTLLLTVTRYDPDLERDVITFSAYYFDNNRGNDTLTSPGVIRTGFSATRSSRLGVPFTFTWTPTDRSPQRGMPASNIIVIMLAGNGAPGRDIESFSSWGRSVNPFR